MNVQSEKSDEATRERQLFVSGLNAHGQLGGSSKRDVRSFRPISLPQPISKHTRVLFACWSTTVLTQEDSVLALGFQRIDHDGDSNAKHMAVAFGAQDGMIGCIDFNGILFVVEPDDGLEHGKLRRRSTKQTPLLHHLALAGNGKVAVILRQESDNNTSHIVLFDSLKHFFDWHKDPEQAETSRKPPEFMIPGRPIQLLASSATFLLLTSRGEVHSWGDPRYQNLGRSVNGEQALRAEQPGIVEALAGIRIEKIACGGWLSAALSEDDALYLWGTCTPGTESRIDAIRDIGVGEVALVEILGNDGSSLDILDVAVGDCHIAVITQDNWLFVVGDNCNGQLGIDEAGSFVEDWTEVTGLSRAQTVVCGPSTTFVFADT